MLLVCVKCCYSASRNSYIYGSTISASYSWLTPIFCAVLQMVICKYADIYIANNIGVCVSIQFPFFKLSYRLSLFSPLHVVVGVLGSFGVGNVVHRASLVPRLCSSAYTRAWEWDMVWLAAYNMIVVVRRRNGWESLRKDLGGVPWGAVGNGYKEERGRNLASLVGFYGYQILGVGVCSLMQREMKGEGWYTS